MTYRKKMVGLSLAFLALLALYVSVLSMKSRTIGKGAAEQPLFVGVEVSELSGFVITGENGEYVFTRSEEGHWYISQASAEDDQKRYDPAILYPGDDGRIHTFLENLFNKTRSAVLSADRSRHRLFSVEEGSVPRLTLQQGTEEKILYIGKQDDGGMGEYARIEGEDDVFIISSVSSYLSRDLTYWGDLSIFPSSLQEDDILLLQFEGTVDPLLEENGEVYGLRKTGSGADSWVFTRENGTPDPVAVERLLRNLVRMKGKDFAPGPLPDTTGTAVINLETVSGEKYSVRVADVGDKVLLTEVGRDIAYEMEKSVFRRIMVSRGELLR